MITGLHCGVRARCDKVAECELVADSIALDRKTPLVVPTRVYMPGGAVASEKKHQGPEDLALKLWRVGVPSLTTSGDRDHCGWNWRAWRVDSRPVAA